MRSILWIKEMGNEEYFVDKGDGNVSKFVNKTGISHESVVEEEEMILSHNWMQVLFTDTIVEEVEVEVSEDIIKEMIVGDEEAKGW